MRDKHSVTEIDYTCQTGIPARVTNLSPVLLYAVPATFVTAIFLLGSIENLDIPGLDFFVRHLTINKNSVIPR